jgi:2,3,4,5-tetrahydropyridine-2,6-dicarboxylate N-succinyltransferase
MAAIDEARYRDGTDAIDAARTFLLSSALTIGTVTVMRNSVGNLAVVKEFDRLPIDADNDIAITDADADAAEAAHYHQLEAVIDKAWNEGTDAVGLPLLREVLDYVMELLNAGRVRVAEREGVGHWRVNEWVRRSLLLWYGLNDAQMTRTGDIPYFDKINSKFAGFSEDEMRASGVRTVPPAMVSHGAYLGRKVFVMPSFVHIGAYVDDCSTIDGWVNVGSGSQIGKRVHLSVGVCIGGVLEPAQQRPTIVEDNCFIGSHCSIVEGVIVEENSVLGMGVHLSQSTKILDRETRQVSYGRIPAGSVVIAGTLPAPDGSYSTACAVIVKKVDAQSRAKTSINDLLRA